MLKTSLGSRVKGCEMIEDLVVVDEIKSESAIQVGLE
jgi:hypothetical protein